MSASQDETAIQAFSAVPGLRIEAGSEARFGTEENTTGRGYPPLCVLHPRDSSQVSQILRCANEHGLPLYPVSRGRNWGLGSRSPMQKGCALLDLSALNGISDFDNTQGTVRIGPGVSFRELAHFLVEQDCDWQAPVIGGPADASVLANALERGDGVGRLGQRDQSIFNCEVLLASGDTLHTGHAGFGLDALNWHNQPPGPGITTLFIQSNLGIVCGAYLQLAPRAVDTQFALLSLASDEDWHQLFAACQRLLHEQLIDPRAVSLWNAAKRRASAGDATLMDDLRRRPQQLCGWSASFFFQTWSEGLMPQKLRLVGDVLGELRGKLQTFADRRDDGTQVASHATGHPDDENLLSLYSAMRDTPEHLSPDEDGVGSQWVCAALPLDAHRALPILRDIERCLIEHGINPNLGVQVVDHRAMHLFVALNFDRGAPGQLHTATDCHTSVCRILEQTGMPLVRLGIHSMGYMDSFLPAQRRWLRALKRAADPNGIIAPGRYL